MKREGDFYFYFSIAERKFLVEKFGTQVKKEIKEKIKLYVLNQEKFNEELTMNDLKIQETKKNIEYKTLKIKEMEIKLEMMVPTADPKTDIKRMEELEKKNSLTPNFKLTHEFGKYYVTCAMDSCPQMFISESDEKSMALKKIDEHLRTTHNLKRYQEQLTK